MKLTAIMAAALTAGIAFGGMTQFAAAQDAPTRLVGGFDVGPGGFPNNVNPLLATTGYMALTLAYEPLVIYDEKIEKVVGRLADSFEISPDGLTYTFKLAADAKWHDGEPFTSKDVAFTLNLAKDTASGSVYVARLSTIAEIATPDDQTVVLTLSQPNSSLLDTLTKVMMLPEHRLAGIAPDTLARNDYWITDPVGTGAFRFKQYSPNQYIEYEAFADYRRGKPKIDQLVNRYFKTPAAAVAALKAGEIAVSYVEADDIKNFQTDSAFRVIEGNSQVVNYLGFNFAAKIWDDVRVRKAVMYAIDRETIIEQLYNGKATAANCGYSAARLVPDGLETYAYDPDKARALLEEAGWGEINGDKPISVLTYYNNDQANNVMAAMQAMLAQVGINIAPRTVDMAGYNATIYAKPIDPSQFQIVYAGLTNGPNPGNLNIGLNAAQIPPNGSNYTRVDIPAVSEAFDTAMKQTTPEGMDKAYSDVCKAMNENLPWATLWETKRYGVESAKLKNLNWQPAPGGGPYEMHPELWELETN
ncbi:ABC transporter substrate-binding protein [Hoeflea olei]|uniref:Peptide ABC transporter substrate-binding protein n=1 Tax=Hoeflea olei TaxID=1480615 RepID=A0A1C1YR83_9HYPH|nr:ABC transporter substrate-binding protein [Hoeflea olei]OCW56018.1 peptide ABC transporter substrate-binding protein [Hoeflea olei]